MEIEPIQMGCHFESRQWYPFFGSKTHSTQAVLDFRPYAGSIAARTNSTRITEALEQIAKRESGVESINSE